jgi:hypothetical protein
MSSKKLKWHTLQNLGPNKDKDDDLYVPPDKAVLDFVKEEKTYRKDLNTSITKDKTTIQRENLASKKEKMGDEPFAHTTMKSNKINTA